MELYLQSLLQDYGGYKHALGRSGNGQSLESGGERTGGRKRKTMGFCVREGNGEGGESLTSSAAQLKYWWVNSGYLFPSTKCAARYFNSNEEGAIETSGKNGQKQKTMTVKLATILKPLHFSHFSSHLSPPVKFWHPHTSPGTFFLPYFILIGHLIPILWGTEFLCFIMVEFFEEETV